MKLTLFKNNGKNLGKVESVFFFLIKNVLVNKEMKCVVCPTKSFAVIVHFTYIPLEPH